MKSVLLEFLSTDEKTLIFVIRQDWEERNIEDKEPLVFEANFTEKDATECVKEIRNYFKEWQDTKYEHAFLTNINLNNSIFGKLSKEIFSKALMESIEGYELIYFVPFSALHHLPLHAMQYKEEYIIDKFACSYLPSASVLQFTNKEYKRPSEYHIKTIGVDFKDELRSFSKEVMGISKETYWQSSKCLIKSNATNENFFAQNENYNVLHCSTHGHFSEDEPLNSAILLYMPGHIRPTSTEGLIEKLEQDENIQQCVITVNDLIKNLNTPFELVFFSACVTGESKNKAGDELIGLSRGLFYSGSKAMIVSLFNTMKNITVTGVPIQNFYRYWIEEKQPKAKAFQHYIQEIKAKEEYKHPFYWFAYILIGNPY
jgi:CHAT domain-containing protein